MNPTPRELLGELGELGAALRAAIESDDVIGAISATTRMRSTRAILARDNVTTIAPDRMDDIAEVVEVATLALRARGAETAMHAWLARELPADEVLRTSPLGAAVVADSMLPTVWDHAIDLVVLVGPGWGLVGTILRDLGQRRIVVVRGDPVDGAIGVETDAELVAAVRTLVPLPPERVAIRGEIGDSKLALESALSDLRIHRNTVRAFSRTWIDHGLANLPAIAKHPSIASWGDRFRGVPMVIVAPGPSLAANSHLLPQLAERAVVLSVGHALKPTIAAGVRPDLVLTVDPQDVRYHFADCDLSRTTVVNAATVHPALFELPARGFATLSANCAIDDWIFDGTGEDVAIPGGGSVATTALSLALKLGCNPIIFVGLDLAFPGGQYYVSTSPDGGARAVVDERGAMRVEGWSGNFHAMKATGGPAASTERAIDLPAWVEDGAVTDARVPSSFMFGLFHRWFEERLRGDLGGARVINATEGGSAIAGMAHRRLRDVIAELPIRDVIDLAVAIPRSRGEAMAKRFATIASRLRRSRELARRALGETDLAKLARIEKILAKSLAPLAFASLLAQHEIERAHQTAQRADGSEDNFLAASRALFRTVIDVIDRLEPAIRTTSWSGPARPS